MWGKKYKIFAASFSSFFTPQKEFSKEGKMSFQINSLIKLIKLIKTNSRIPWNQSSGEEVPGVYGENHQIHLNVKERN